MSIDDVVDWCAGSNTSQLVVANAGEVVAEHFWNGAGPSTTQDIASIQKVATAVVLGQLVDENLVDLDEPAATYLGDGWTNLGPEEPSVTVRHLITMTSGLDENFDFDHPPGTHWYYNNTGYHQLRKRRELVTGLSSNDLFGQRLFGPLGMESAHFVDRPRMTDRSGWVQSGLHCSARDLITFGLAVMSRSGLGCSSEFVDEMLAPSSSLNPSYGYLWWLLGGATAVMPGHRRGQEIDPRKAFGRLEVDRPIAAAAPRDAVAGMGMGDQRLYLVPSLDLAIARLGGPAFEVSAAGGWFDAEFWSLWMQEATS